MDVARFLPACGGGGVGRAVGWGWGGMEKDGERQEGFVLRYTGLKSYSTCHVIRLSTNNPHE